MGEKWKPVTGFEELYIVSNKGRVKNNRGHILKTQINRGGYEKIGLYRHPVKTYHTIHRLVAQAFIPNPENKPHINHIDAVKTNNGIGNLEWCTPSENIKHAFKMGNKNQKGEKNNGAKLNPFKVASIRKMAKEGVLQKDIAEFYGISKGNVCLIVNRETWKHV